MSEEPSIDFDEIRGDYAFFLAHSTESTGQIASLRSHLARLAGLPTPVRLLDFGCGAGDFLARLLGESNLSPERLEVSLEEPSAIQRSEAAAQIARLARRVNTFTDAEGRGESFDLILANHSYYYVPDPEAATARLLRALSPGGQLVAALLDRSNALAQLWQAGFSLADEAFPFTLAEDLEAILRRHGVEPRREMVRYRIEFPDNPEACTRVLRFLFGAHLAKLRDDSAQALFDPYRLGGAIVIETEYPHLLAQKPRPLSIQA